MDEKERAENSDKANEQKKRVDMVKPSSEAIPIDDGAPERKRL